MIVRWAVILDPFLDNDSVKHVPAATVTYATGKRGVAYAVRAEELKRRELG
jgi:hypothetical protein